MFARMECRTNPDSPEWIDMEVLDAVTVAYQLERSQDASRTTPRPPLPDHFQQSIHVAGLLQKAVLSRRQPKRLPRYEPRSNG